MGSKSKNIHEIASELNIGLDSLVFVDDNPAERDLIRKEFGTLISVPELGDDVAKYRSILDGADLFTLTTLSREDKKEVNIMRAIRKEKIFVYF